LLALTTISVTVAKQVQKINVKIIEPPPAVEETEVEGAPSLNDLAGQLRPVITQPRTAGSVAGPSSSAAVANVRAPDLPRIGVGPSIGAQPGNLDIPLSFGGSGLAGGGPGGGGFGDMLGSLRKVGVDLVLLIDTTNSMQSIIDQVKNEVRAFIGNLQQMVPASRVAVVAYRDKGDEYVTSGSTSASRPTRSELRRQPPRRRRGDYPRPSTRRSMPRPSFVAEDLAPHQQSSSAARRRTPRPCRPC
jgi:hypothetical protein